MTTDSQLQPNNEQQTVQKRKRIVSDTIISNELQTKIRMSGDGLRKRKVVLPKTFKITENYIKNQIDGLVPKNNINRKRRTRQLIVHEEIDNPVIQTVQAIISEPEPIPVSFPHPAQEIQDLEVSIPFHSIEEENLVIEVPQLVSEIFVHEEPVIISHETSIRENAEVVKIISKTEVLVGKKRIFSIRKIGVFIGKIFTEFAKRDPRRQRMI